MCGENQERESNQDWRPFDAVPSPRDYLSDLSLTRLTYSTENRWFDFLGRKDQHDPFHVDKEVFCDSLLDLVNAIIRPRSRTTPRPPGSRHREGILLSATISYIDNSPHHLTCLGRRLQ
jgi:hypothetical protein